MNPGKLLAVIGDEDTCVGFLLSGIGNVDGQQANFFVVDGKTTEKAIVDAFKRFVNDDNICMIIITQNVANMIRGYIDSHVRPQPAVIEIPSRNHPYDISQDSVMRRAISIFAPKYL